MNTEIPQNRPKQPSGGSASPGAPKTPNIEFDEFKDFLQSELGSPNTQSPRRVVALSEGLGLESPKKLNSPLKTELAAGFPTELSEPISQERSTRSTPPTPPPARRGTPLSTDDLVKMPTATSERNRSRLAFVMDNPPPRVAEETLEAERSTHKETTQTKDTRPATPPALPTASSFRRLLATLLDETFVWMLFLVTLVVTVNLAKGFEPGFSVAVLKQVLEPELLRLAALEFVLVWLGYFAITVGLSNRTFGMWVWGLRVSYGNRNDDNYALRRLMRVFWSILFFAPAVLLPLLAFRRNGRNILDTLSGSNLYGSTA